MEILSLTGNFGGNNADFNYVSLTYAFGTVRRTHAMSTVASGTVLIEK